MSVALVAEHKKQLVSAALEMFDCRNSRKAVYHARQSGAHSAHRLSCKVPRPEFESYGTKKM